MSETAARSAPVIDAYMHVGSPRFGTARQALGACDLWGTDRAILVLGPRVPDIPALIEAQRLRPGAVRAIGIPYGDTPERRLRCAEACLTAGALGIRMQGDEPLENPGVMELLGSNARWIYATDPLASPRHSAALLDWLARFPYASLAAPHFLRPSLALLDDPLAEELVRHPRFYAILSRQGQVGSRGPYPFRDLQPWVGRMLDWCGPERMLWGSEYPVTTWRGEQIDQTRRWLRDVGVDWREEDLVAVTGGNAERLFFRGASPEVREPALPDWLRDYPPPGPVPLSPTSPLNL
ncbi:MAG: amidohydrolase family protein, partial [Anaerolineae bacterium]